jgi:hypothetical protein
MPTSQFDDSRRVEALMIEMQARPRLPISVHPAPALVKLAKKQGLGIYRIDSLIILLM